MAKIPELKAPAAPAKPQAKPLNAKCPVNEENAKAEFTIAVSGKVIGFCSQSCLGKFNRMPGAYINNIPELKGGTAKKPDDKPGAKPEEKKEPEHTGPCEVKKTAKGMWCMKCDRELTMDDVRNKACKRCETKPEDIEYCVKSTGLQFTAECHPNKKDTKPVS